MTENEKKENIEEEKPKTKAVLEAEEVVKKLKEENDRKEELIQREEEMISRRILDGNTEAGIQKEEEPKEETAKEYAEKALRGDIK